MDQVINLAGLGIASSEQFGIPFIAITPVGIPSGEAFGQPSASEDRLGPSGIASDERFGNSIIVQHYSGSGTVNTGGTAGVRLLFQFPFTISWRIQKPLNFDLDLLWNVGAQPYCYYQVQSPCIPPLPTSSTSSTTATLASQECAPPCTAQFQTTILAKSPADVCRQLAASGTWQWPIGSINKSNDCLNQTPSCVTYTPVMNFKQIPECLQFALRDDAIATLGMDAVLTENIYRYSGTGGVFTFGTADVSCPSCISVLSFSEFFWPEPLIIEPVEVYGLASIIDVTTDMGSDQSLDSIEAIFGTSPAPELTPPLTTVTNRCGCTNIPPLLQLTGDLYRCQPLTNFLKRNGLSLPNIFNMGYSSVYQGWQSSLHFSGVGNDDKTVERWSVLLEWQCTSIVGGVDLGNPLWLFTMQVSRRGGANNAESKAILAFNAADVCSDTNRLGFDFRFQFNVFDTTVQTGSGVGSDIHVVTDNLAIFQSTDFQNNPLFSVNISGSENGIFVPHEDIRPIVPVKPDILQFAT
jgi:hypothetical protein